MISELSVDVDKRRGMVDSVVDDEVVDEDVDVYEGDQWTFVKPLSCPTSKASRVTL